MTMKEMMDPEFQNFKINYATFSRKLEGKNWEQSIAIINENMEKLNAYANAMMTDSLISKDNGGISVGFGGAKVGLGGADNSLTCASEGNCMLKD